MISFLNPNVLAAMLIAASLSFGSGYFYGRHSESAANEAEQNKALIDALTKVRQTEEKLQTQVEQVSNEYETQIAQLAERASVAERDLGRLRVKPRCGVPSIAVSPGKSNATAEHAAVGRGTGEIDLDDVAKQTIELGRDFDAANIKIAELQSLIRTYENACKIN